MVSISDVDLTNVSGFLDKIAKCPGSAIMADRGFTIKETLKRSNLINHHFWKERSSYQYRMSRMVGKLLLCGSMHTCTILAVV